MMMDKSSVITMQTAGKSLGDNPQRRIEQLREKIVLDMASVDDYHTYFDLLIANGRTDKKTVDTLFTEKGFTGIDDYVEKRQAYVDKFKYSQINWTEHNRIKGWMEDRIVSLSFEKPPAKPPRYTRHEWG